MVFIKKYILKLFKMICLSYLFFKVVMVMVMLEKLCIFKVWLKNVKYQKSKTYTLTALTKHSMCMCLLLTLFKSHLKKKQDSYFLRIPSKNIFFWKLLLFHMTCIVWQIFTWFRHFYRYYNDFLKKKCYVNMFWIDFLWIFKEQFQYNRSWVKVGYATKHSLGVDSVNILVFTSLSTGFGKQEESV